MILYNKRITKALIRLHRCAGWSAPLLFVNPEDRFSRVKAQIEPEVPLYICSRGKKQTFSGEKLLVG